MTRYTRTALQHDFPNQDACLEYLFYTRYGQLAYCTACGTKTTYVRVKKRRVYECPHCLRQLSPTAGTIFHKSKTPLTSWFYAIYLFSVSKNGVSAKELQRHLGVTYKCAWRMARQIRLLMQPDSTLLTGIVEVDETYIGGTRRGYTGMGAAMRKYGVQGMVERGGRITARVIPNAKANVLVGNIADTVSRDATIMTDQHRSYMDLAYQGYPDHWVVNHSRGEFVVGTVHTNTIEGFWGQMKRSISGTYHVVSRQHLQHYVNEFAWRYSHRKSETPLFWLLLDKAAGPVDKT